MPIRASECFVTIEQRLDGVLSGFQVAQTMNRVPENAGIRIVHDARLTRLPTFDVYAENNLSFWALVNLETRFLGGVSREHNQQTAIEWCGALCRIERYGEDRCRLGGAWRLRE